MNDIAHMLLTGFIHLFTYSVAANRRLFHFDVANGPMKLPLIMSLAIF